MGKMDRNNSFVKRFSNTLYIFDFLTCTWRHGIGAGGIGAEEWALKSVSEAVAGFRRQLAARIAVTGIRGEQTRGMSACTHLAILVISAQPKKR
jgi:hypothetical protein